MKTATSIPGDVLQRADRLAILARKSRVQLFRDAVRECFANARSTRTHEVHSLELLRSPAKGLFQTFVLARQGAGVSRRESVTTFRATPGSQTSNRGMLPSLRIGGITWTGRKKRPPYVRVRASKEFRIFDAACAVADFAWAAATGAFPTGSLVRRPRRHAPRENSPSLPASWVVQAGGSMRQVSGGQFGCAYPSLLLLAGFVQHDDDIRR